MVRISACIFSIFVSATCAEAASCGLSHDECVIVEREIIMSEMASLRDYEALRSMAAYPRAIKVVELKYDRLGERFKHLPIKIGNELARLVKCEVELKRNAQVGQPISEGCSN
ncbi:hypothetical+protein [Methylocapsa aurea]|uniref:hypothetical protein n=1 Tax=Methylocapsa aurea TaxID=663610 RepID=UPI003D188598